MALRVTEAGGGFAIVTTTVLLNAPPRAGFTVAPGNPFAGDTTTISSTSIDPDGPLVSQQWDLDADGQFDDASGPLVSETFANAGRHEIRLRVTDSKGAVATASGPVDVLARPLAPLPDVVIDINGSVTGRVTTVRLLRVHAPRERLRWSSARASAVPRRCPNAAGVGRSASSPSSAGTGPGRGADCQGHQPGLHRPADHVHDALEQTAQAREPLPAPGRKQGDEVPGAMKAGPLTALAGACTVLFGASFYAGDLVSDPDRPAAPEATPARAEPVASGRALALGRARELPDLRTPPKPRPAPEPAPQPVTAANVPAPAAAEPASSAPAPEPAPAPAPAPAPPPAPAPAPPPAPAPAPATPAPTTEFWGSG